MKCSYFLYSVLLLVVVGGCCKLDDSPLRLTATDKELLPNQIGDTIRLKDMATGTTYTYVIDSVDASLQPSFGNDFFSVKKSGCASKRLEIEVGKTTFIGGLGGYRFARSSDNSLLFNLKLNNLNAPLELNFTIENDDILGFIKFRESFTLNQNTYNNVYEIYNSFGGDQMKYVRMLIHKDEGLIYVDDQIQNNLLLVKP